MSYRGRILVEAPLSKLNMTEIKRRQKDIEQAIGDKINEKKLRLTEQDRNESSKAENENVDKNRRENQMSTRKGKNTDEIEKEAEKENYSENQSENQRETQSENRRKYRTSTTDKNDTDESNITEEDSDDTNEDPDVHSSSSDSSSGNTSSSDSTGSAESVLQEREEGSPEAQGEAPNVEQATTSDSNDGKRGKKLRTRPSRWVAKKTYAARNKGESYISRSKSRKEMRARALRPPCTDKCKLECSTKISQEIRQALFEDFWGLGNLQLQREYIARFINPINPKYRYPREGSTRSCNHAFYLAIHGKNVRVCKTFFKATLDINDRPIRTVIMKTKGGIIEPDKRGKHGKQLISVDPIIKQGIRDHINSIPRIESHYLRAQTTREYIEGGKSVASLHRDYVVDCAEKNLRCGNLTMYTRIFNMEFNISFFTPKKDQCELCTAFNNAQNEEKAKLEEKYDIHLKEKVLSRQEKQRDKELADVNEHYIVATYDLQAVLPAPRGEVSVFYYKSKLNSYNFTVSAMRSGDVQCFFWHEGEANRGANEIATCVFKYLERIAATKKDDDLEIIFFSDNCCGQQKNKFVLGMYLFAVQKLNIKSITHKFLIKGHTQNEGDNIHSVIEKAIKRALKSGPIYYPSEYARIIRSAKVAGVPYKVTEMCHTDFIDFKQLVQKLGNNFNTTDDGLVKMGDIKVVKAIKDEPGILYLKTSYEQKDYVKINVNGKRRTTPNISTLECKAAYSRKIAVADKKKADILDLIKANHIPRFYEPLYNIIFN